MTLPWVTAWPVLVLALGCVSADGEAAAAPPSSAAPPPAKRAVEPAAQPVAAPAASEELPPSKRIRGTWAMNLNDAPKAALAKDFQRFKSSKELADMVRVEYTVSDADWVLRKYGAGGVYEQRWHYQILKELGDHLLLERTGEDGDVQRIEVEVGDDVITIGTGNGKVPLRRIR